MMPGTRPPFQGDSLGDVFPRAEAHGLFCFRPLSDGKMSKLKAQGVNPGNRHIIRNRPEKAADLELRIALEQNTGVRNSELQTRNSELRERRNGERFLPK